VEITGNAAPDNQEERRRAIASRIVIGREEIERMGDNSLAEVLKRLPGVTLGGPPGRGGGPRMRGMGGGYTLILIDGQRMPPGFSLDNVPPEQIERIEVMRAPVAEFSARGIAGIINVVMRSDFKRRANEARFGAGVDGRRPQAGGNWQRNGQTDTLGYNLSISGFRSGQDNESTTRTQGGEDDNGRPLVDQAASSTSRSNRNALFGTGRLQFRLGPGKTLDVQPFANVVRADTHGQSARSAETAAATDALAFTAARWDSRNESKTLRLNGTWITSTDSGGRLQARASTMLAQSDSHLERLETGGTALGGRVRIEDARSRDQSLDLSGRFSQLLAERHSIAMGWELQHNQRQDFQRTLIDGQPLAAGLGDEIDATIQRVALFAQDEWEWDKQLSFYLGARWEGIRTEAVGAVAADTANRSSVFTPLAHMVWKLPDRPRDQIRLSLTRSYRSPNTNQLIARPVVNTLYSDLTRTNTPTSPDRSGNPALLPELAWSLELGYERYLEAGGILTANAYFKRIDNLIRNVTPDRPEAVGYATAPRYLSRPINFGQADSAGLELEARLRAADLWTTDQNIALRSNLSLMWSRVDGVQGPNNRIEGQPPWTLNLGADWTVRGTPLTLGGSWGYTPGFELQQIDAQATRQGKKSALDAYALWRLNPEASLRLTLNNLLAQDYDSGSTRYNANGSVYQVSDTRARTYTTVNLRAEIKF
jgi:iron complex outermembrane receptor protein